MSKLDKRAISILVIATFLMSMIPFMPAQAVLTDVFLRDFVDGANYDGVYGDTIVVKGTAGEATSGATIEIYWDTAIGEDALLLNSTKAKADGNYEVWFDVPKAVNGLHYVWAKDVSGPFYASSGAFTVNEIIKLSPSSGLYGDDVDVKGYGFGDETIVNIVIGTFTVTDEAVGTGTGAQTLFQLDHYPVAAGTQVISVAETPQVEDTHYTFVDSTGVITFLTGAIPASGALVTATYTTAEVYTIEDSATFKTDELGSFTKTFDVPDYPYGNYDIIATDDDLAGPYTDDAIFIVGASISVTPEEGPTGTVVTVSGRGWTTGYKITFSTGVAAGGTPVIVVGSAVVTVASGGKFSANVVIPGGVAEDKIKIWATETGAPALPKVPSSDSFEVTGLPEIVVSPTYGSPGATINVNGYNFTQISGTEVVIELRGKGGGGHVADLVIAETKSDGTFEDTFMSPAVTFIGYDVNAEDTVYHITAVDAFKVGLIALIINPTYGEAGDSLIISFTVNAPPSN